MQRQGLDRGRSSASQEGVAGLPALQGVVRGPRPGLHRVQAGTSDLGFWRQAAGSEAEEPGRGARRQGTGSAGEGNSLCERKELIVDGGRR